MQIVRDIEIVKIDKSNREKKNPSFFFLSPKFFGYGRVRLALTFCLKLNKQQISYRNLKNERTVANENYLA